MFYKLLDLFTENGQINRDVVQLCHVLGSQSSSSNFPTRLINEGSALWGDEEGKSCCWMIHLIGGTGDESPAMLAG